MDKTKVSAIFSVPPRKGESGVPVKDGRGRVMYRNASRSSIAVEGKVILVALKDTFFGGEGSAEYRSRVLTNPTWATVFAEFKRAIAVTKDQHHMFLEGVHPYTRIVHGKPVAVTSGDNDEIKVYRFSAGS